MRDVLEWMRDEDGQARPIGFVGSSTEPTPGATLLACEPGVARLPLAEEMIPMAHRRLIDGNVVHNSDSAVRARILDSDRTLPNSACNGLDDLLRVVQA